MRKHFREGLSHPTTKTKYYHRTKAVKVRSTFPLKPAAGGSATRSVAIKGGRVGVVRRRKHMENAMIYIICTNGTTEQTRIHKNQILPPHPLSPKSYFGEIRRNGFIGGEVRLHGGLRSPSKPLRRVGGWETEEKKTYRICDDSLHLYNGSHHMNPPHESHTQNHI